MEMCQKKLGVPWGELLNGVAGDDYRVIATGKLNPRLVKVQMTCENIMGRSPFGFGECGGGARQCRNQTANSPLEIDQQLHNVMPQRQHLLQHGRPTPEGAGLVFA